MAPNIISQVKNKTTVPRLNRKYSVLELSSIPEDPTSFGIPGELLVAVVKMEADLTY